MELTPSDPDLIGSWLASIQHAYYRFLLSRWGIVVLILGAVIVSAIGRWLFGLVQEVEDGLRAAMMAAYAALILAPFDPRGFAQLLEAGPVTIVLILAALYAVVKELRLFRESLVRRKNLPE